jgi:signal recognition particle GTPase
MNITILDAQSNTVLIIPACISQNDAIAAAKSQVREAALDGVTLTAVDEDGVDVLAASPAEKYNPNVKFEGYERDVLGDNLACFSFAF